MFQKDELVTYGTQGVCRIADICEREFGKMKNTYYVLAPVYEQRSTVYVPVDQETLVAKMRRVLSKEEITALIRSMPKEDFAWAEDEQQRREQYKAALSSGDRSKLVRMIKALYLQQQERKANGKKLHLADENFLKEAEKRLYDEFAFVLGISRDEVLSYITQEIESEDANT